MAGENVRNTQVRYMRTAQLL